MERSGNYTGASGVIPSQCSGKAYRGNHRAWAGNIMRCMSLNPIFSYSSMCIRISISIAATHSCYRRPINYQPPMAQH